MQSIKPIAAIFLFLPYLLLSAQHVDSSEKPTLTDKTESIHVDITTHLGDRQTFMEGDTISFFLSLGIDAYLLLVYKDASGQITQILPNSNQKNNYYKAGIFIAVPGENASFSFKVQAPFGQETLWAFASDSPLPELKGQLLSNGLKQLKSNITTIKKRVIKHTQSAFGEAKLLIQTKAKNHIRQ